MREKGVLRFVCTAAAVIAAVVVVACAAQPAPQPAPIASASPTASPRPAESATPATPPSSAPSASTAPALPRLPRRKSTPGKISCETTDCDLATEICCAAIREDGSARGTCVPKPAERYPSPCCKPGEWCSNDGNMVERSCDESADCSAGQQCGDIDPLEGGLGYQECQTRWPVEVCLAGSTCKNGNACQADDAATVGICNLQIAPPRCGQQTCKVGETCCWSSEEHRGSCAAECGPDDLALRCTSPEQCDHSDCDSLPGPSGYDCGGHGFQFGILCRTVRDCPNQATGIAFGPGAPTLKGCKHLDWAPPSVKSCVYE